jgi:hypothetical protein
MKPSAVLPPLIPSTLHVMPVFELPVTVAVYCDEVPSTTLAAPFRVTVTVGGGGAGAASVTVRLRATVESAMLVAVIVTFDEPGWAVGAV